ncbi:MAG: hypothetical protein K9M75_00075 [Phycisphaerae bacterium]|nr:hypothetical protein [Phycisphaerae bacterium]
MGVTSAWRHFNNVSVPPYIPQDSHWKLITKESSRPWNLPCVYTRFEVEQPQSIVADQIKKVISELRKWEEFSEESSESIYTEINDPLYKGVDKEFRQQQMERRMSPYSTVIGKNYSLHTERPFMLFKWYGREPETHHFITIRLIDTDDNQTIVELWDLRIFDM